VETSVGDRERLEMAIPLFFGVAKVVPGGRISSKNPRHPEEQGNRRGELMKRRTSATRGGGLSEGERRFEDAHGVEGHSCPQSHPRNDDREGGDALVELEFLGPQEGALHIVSDLAIQASVEAKDLARVSDVLETIGDLGHEVGTGSRRNAVREEDPTEGCERPRAPIGERLHEACEARRAIFRRSGVPAVKGGERDEALAGLRRDPRECGPKRRLVSAANGIRIRIKSKFKSIARRSRVCHRSSMAPPARRALRDSLAAGPFGEPAGECDDRAREAVDGTNKGNDATQRRSIEGEPSCAAARE
jgi:hypothetical protein